MFTMVLVFCVIVVEKIASETSVFAEPNATLFTVRLHFLASVALRTDEFFELLSIKSVSLGIVMTKTTRVNLPATWTLLRKKVTLFVVDFIFDLRFVDLEKFFSFLGFKVQKQKLELL